MAERQVLQEFLAKLGFEVNQPSMKSFLLTLKNNCLTAGKLSAGLVGVGLAAEGMAALFARSSEKMYYASQRIKGSAGNIQAVEFGAKQIGLNAEDARASLEGIAAVLRRPMAGGLLDMLGVQHGGGRDTVDVLLDTIQQLKQQFSGDQYFVGEGFAESLGIDKRTYLMMSERIDELRKFYEDRKRMAAAAGVDSDRAAKAGQEYMRGVNELWEKIGLMGDRLKIELLEPFKEVNAELSQIITQFTNWLGSDEGRNSIKAMMVHFVALGEVVSETAKSITALKNFDMKGANEHDEKAFAAMMYTLGIGDPTPTIQRAIDAAARGKGNLQVFPGGGAASNDDISLPGWLSDRDIDNVMFLHDQLKKHKWSPYNQFRIGNEIDSILARPSDNVLLGRDTGNGGVTIEINSTVQVSGARDPEATAAAVDRTQRRVMGDVVRNLEGVVR